MKYQKRMFALAFVIILIFVFVFFVLHSSVIPRRPFVTPDASYYNWDEILSHPKQITIHTYSTGIMQTPLSGIMNLQHEKARDIENKSVEIPVIVLPHLPFFFTYVSLTIPFMHYLFNILL